MTSPLPAAERARIAALLAPTGVLRAGINLSNFLLVSRRTPDGGPAGVSPDMARALADSLGLRLQYVPYPNPAQVADAAGKDEWDVALIGAEPQRAEVIAFTPAYAEIEATYLVPEKSTAQTVADVDAPGGRIAAADRTAFGLWLDLNLKAAEIHRVATMDDALEAFRTHDLDALAGLRARLIDDQKAVPGSRILDGRFMTVQQAIGVPRAKEAALPYMVDFVAEARRTGLVQELIRRHKVQGLTAA